MTIYTLVELVMCPSAREMVAQQPVTLPYAVSPLLYGVQTILTILMAFQYLVVPLSTNVRNLIIIIIISSLTSLFFCFALHFVCCGYASACVHMPYR